MHRAQNQCNARNCINLGNFTLRRDVRTIVSGGDLPQRASRRICGWRAAVQMASAAKAFLFLAALTTKSVGKLGRSPPETIVLTWPPAETYAPKYDKAVECLTKDRDALLAFYDFPAEHWKHLRSTNPIESTFATVRHRTIRSKGCLSNKTALAMVFKLIEAAQKSWRCLDGHNQLPKLITGVMFADGIEVVAQPARLKPTPPDPSGRQQDSAIALWQVVMLGSR